MSTVVEVFGHVVLPSSEPGYRVLVCGTEPVADAGPLRIAIHHGIDAFAGADTVVVTGRNDVTVDTSNDVLGTLRSAFTAGTRIASICSSAFTLTAAGLFDETMRDDALGYLDPLMLRGGLGVVDAMPRLDSVDERAKTSGAATGPGDVDTDVADIPGAGSQPHVTVVGKVRFSDKGTKWLKDHV